MATVKGASEEAYQALWLVYIETISVYIYIYIHIYIHFPYLCIYLVI